MSHSRLVDNSRQKMSYKQKMRNMVGHEEFTKPNIYKALVAEFIGTGLLVLVGCGSVTPWDEKDKPSVLQIGMTFGLIVATMVQCICHISGGHINPAVSMGCVVAGHCSVIRGLLYLIVQLLGAVVGAAVLKGVTPSEVDTQLGNTALGKNMNGGKALVVEFCITFVLVFTVLSVVDSKRKDVKGSAPLAIGLSITACHLWAVKFTGSSMNTARTFGPAVILGNFGNHYVYWIGPLLGGLVAGLLYKFLFEAPEEDEKQPPKPLEDAEEGDDAEAGKGTAEKGSPSQDKKAPPKV